MKIFPIISILCAAGILNFSYAGENNSAQSKDMQSKEAQPKEAQAKQAQSKQVRDQRGKETMEFFQSLEKMSSEERQSALENFRKKRASEKSARAEPTKEELEEQEREMFDRMILNTKKSLEAMQKETSKASGNSAQPPSEKSAKTKQTSQDEIKPTSEYMQLRLKLQKETSKALGNSAQPPSEKSAKTKQTLQDEIKPTSEYMQLRLKFLEIQKSLVGKSPEEKFSAMQTWKESENGKRMRELSDEMNKAREKQSLEQLKERIKTLEASKDKSEKTLRMLENLKFQLEMTEKTSPEKRAELIKARMEKRKSAETNLKKE